MSATNEQPPRELLDTEARLLEKFPGLTLTHQFNPDKKSWEVRVIAANFKQLGFDIHQDWLNNLEQFEPLIEETFRRVYEHLQ